VRDDIDGVAEVNRDVMVGKLTGQALAWHAYYRVD
jgi:hypothetical protein